MSKTEKIIAENDSIYVKKTGLSLYIKTADLVEMIGKSNQWIGQLVKKGSLTKHRTKHGVMFNLTETIKAYCGILEERAKDEGDSEFLEIEKSKVAAELRIKESKALIAELEAKEVKGEMHRSEDVRKMTEELVYSFRTALIALPGRVAVDVSNADSAAEAAEIIKLEAFKIMEELEQFKYDSAKYDERVRERRKWNPASDNAS